MTIAVELGSDKYNLLVNTGASCSALHIKTFESLNPPQKLLETPFQTVSGVDGTVCSVVGALETYIVIQSRSE